MPHNVSRLSSSYSRQSLETDFSLNHRNGSIVAPARSGISELPEVWTPTNTSLSKRASQESSAVPGDSAQPLAIAELGTVKVCSYHPILDQELLRI